MDSGMTHKLIKARQYAEEPERIQILSMSAELEGDDRLHLVGFDGGKWSCDCEYFDGHRVCAHSMALQRILGDMVKQRA